MFNKKNVFILVLAFLLVFSTGVFAASNKTIQATIADAIKVKLNGKTLDLKDTTGASVSPVLINGTTYLPVRFIAETVGLSVNWDGATQSVLLGENTEYRNLSDVSKIEETLWGNFVQGEVNLTFNQIGDVGVKYQNGLKMPKINNYPREVPIKLGAKQTKLSTDILYTNTSEDSPVSVQLINDKNIAIYDKTLNPDELINIVDLDISGTQKLTLKVVGKAGTKGEFYLLNPRVK